jgi:hypothetical protein
MRPLLILALALLYLAFVGCDKKSSYSGRWISKGTRVDKGFISSDKTDVIVRTLTLDANGNGELNITLKGQTIYLRVVRITNERFVIRNPDGSERFYDRLQ